MDLVIQAVTYTWWRKKCIVENYKFSKNKIFKESGNIKFVCTNNKCSCNVHTDPSCIRVIEINGLHNQQPSCDNDNIQVEIVRPASWQMAQVVWIPEDDRARSVYLALLTGQSVPPHLLGKTLFMRN